MLAERVSGCLVWSDLGSQAADPAASGDPRPFAERDSKGRKASLGTEAPDLRTPTSRTYVDGEGRHVARLFGHAVNFRGNDGKFARIDNRLVASDRSGYAFRNAANRYQADLPADASKPVRFEAGGDWVTFGLQGAAGTGRSEGATADYGTVLDGVSLRYEVAGDGLREILTLASAAAPREFAFDLATGSGVRARQAGDRVEFLDSSDQVLFTFAAPYMRDSSGALGGVLDEGDTRLGGVGSGGAAPGSRVAR